MSDVVLLIIDFSCTVMCKPKFDKYLFCQEFFQSFGFAANLYYGQYSKAESIIYLEVRRYRLLMRRFID